MEIIKWTLIMIGTAVGTVLAWRYQVPILALLLLAYAACFSIKLPKLQLAIVYLYAGLTFGLGLHFLIGLGGKYDYVGMVVAPLLIWLILRVIFYGVETKYTLTPNPATTQQRDTVETDADNRNDTVNTSTSAWAGDNTGQAAIPDVDGQYMRYEYFATGEIAMGGPTYGDVIFNNGCAFGGVGPSIVISDDGHYAAMTLPSRNGWGLLIADLRNKHVYEVNDGSFWEIDRIENNIIYGRHSPITSNAAQQLSITQAIQTANELPMVQDDGWWVIDYPSREPFQQYKAVTITSQQGTHKVTFVPDLKPFKNNPFLRSQHPMYTVLVDDALIDQDTRIPVATWINGHDTDSVQDGRFLLIASQVIDFKDAANDAFSIKNRTVLPFIKGCDDNTNLSFEYGEFNDANDGFLMAKAYVLPRSTGWDDAEYTAYSCTSPWDEEEVTYWDSKKQKRVQARKQVQRFIEYKIDLDKYSRTKQLKNCVEINLTNRANAKNTASLAYANQSNEQAGYSVYQLTTSCGVTLENVIHEAIWSHCGRYLAVVHFAAPPLVPHQISIIDFKTAIVKNITGSYALPSFIWFDSDMLDFTHLIGIDEHLNFGPNRTDDETQQLRIRDAAYAQNPYLLLIDGIAKRQIEAEKRVKLKKSKIGYSGATLSQIAQHCILFAPNFDTPILQPPFGVENT